MSEYADAILALPVIAVLAAVVIVAIVIGTRK